MHDGRPVYELDRQHDISTGPLAGTEVRDVRFLFYDKQEKQWAVAQTLGVPPFILATRSDALDPQLLTQNGDTQAWVLTSEAEGLRA